MYDYRLSRLCAALYALMFAAFPAVTANAQTYTSTDGQFSFTYPQHWEVANASAGIKITASDGAAYLIKLDTIQSLPTGSPANDSGLKQTSAKLAEQLASNASFVRATSVSMDHGQGASFRYKTAAGDNIDVWVGIIGKHSAVLTPVKTGQASQTIGLSVVFQTMAFADALPKPPPVRTQQPDKMANTPGAGGPKTVMFSKQILPILQQRCVACHNGQSASGGLNASNYSSFLAGGTRGANIKPGDPASSSLIDYLTGARDRMPKGSDPLAADQISLFRTWIREGAENDLDPSSSRTSTSRFNPPPSNTGSPNAQPRRNANRAANRASTLGPKPLESYAGHLASNDNSFTLRLFTNKSATAEWQFEKPNPARFEGTYAVTNEVYVITMDLVSGSVPGGTKSLKLVMTSNGTNAIGKFSLDDTAPKYKIMDLQLSDMEASPRNGGGARNNSKGRKPKQRSSSAARRQQQLIRRMQQQLERMERAAIGGRA